MANSLTVQGSATTLSGVVQVNFTQTYATPVGTVLNVPLAMGDNIFSVPTGTTSILIQPPTGNAVLITLKGDASDPVGIDLHKTLQTGPININATCTQIDLYAASAITALVNIKFL